MVSCFLWGRFEGDPGVEAAVVWRFGFVSDGPVETGKRALFPEGFGELASPSFVFLLAFGFGGVSLILRDVVTVWVGNFNGLSSPR